MKMLSAEQTEVCVRYGASPEAVEPAQKVGIALSVRTGLLPINGLRHPPSADTTGWYIWAGEQLSEDPEFFVPLHVEHLPDWSQAVLPFLALPAGYRFLVAESYVDVWFDPSLLDVDEASP